VTASALVNAVGVAAALCSMTSFAPQIIKIWKERDATSVSLRTYAVTVTGFALWIVYGVLLGSWPVAASNTVCLLMAAAVLAMKLRFSKG
jgi:MtN3 and saliva related transmembrane protein